MPNSAKSTKPASATPSAERAPDRPPRDEASRDAPTSRDEAAYDVLILGGGLAGLSLALRLPQHLKVCILAKGSPKQSNTWFAQGGISAAIDRRDSVAAHIDDTLRAGAGLCHREAVEAIVSAAPAEIAWLRSLQVDFTTTRDQHGREQLHLSREGGHSHRRVVHSEDRTGRRLQVSLTDAVRARENITVRYDRAAIDLILSKPHDNPQPAASDESRNNPHANPPAEPQAAPSANSHANSPNNPPANPQAASHSDSPANPQPTASEKRCVGAYVLEPDNRVCAYRARATVLATGGVGKVYLYTSNPSAASGDGVAMAWRAGCRVANLEFMQFHPTCLYAPGAETVLLSEALRGEGARLTLPDGERFMRQYDERGELATRDVVAFAIDREMKRLGIECVYLDISHRAEADVRKLFPSLRKLCRARGFDLARERVPVVPAAHYMCGGVVTDLNARTDIADLYAVGEVAHTGLHGANRMASNSLLECLACARFAAESLTRELELPTTSAVAQDAPQPWDESRVTRADEKVITLQAWHEVRRLMWNYVGIARTVDRLHRAQQRIELIRREIEEHYAKFRVTADFVELRNMATVAALIIRSALSRKESRGLHRIADYPQPRREYEGRDTLLQRAAPPATD